MDRRSGQNGTVVIAGNWYRVRWRIDVDGQEKRVNMSEKVAPVVFDRNGEPKLPSVEVLRKAREIVEKSGANSDQRFNRVVLGEVSFESKPRHTCGGPPHATGNPSGTVRVWKPL